MEEQKQGQLAGELNGAEPETDSGKKSRREDHTDPETDERRRLKLCRYFFKIQDAYG